MADDSDGSRSDATWVVDRADENRAIFAPRPKPQWKFLTKWFKSLTRRCAISDLERVDTHAVRIGREMDDQWIDVLVENGSTTNETGRWAAFRKPVTAEQRAEKLRGVREALLLGAAMARVDYASWISSMVRRAHFPVPHHLELQHCPEIPREFCFFLSTYLGPEYYQWDLLQHIMGDDSFSEAFADDMDKIVQIAKQSDCELKLFVEVPVKLATEPEGTDGEKLERELTILRGVIDTVRQMLAMNERNRTTSAAPTRPYFRFDGVELKLRSLTMHPDVYDLIRELLETGVNVTGLALPTRTPRRQNVSEAKLQAAWGSLVATALGHRALDTGRVVLLDHLTLDGVYMTETFMIPLCSALRDTRVLQRLTLYGGELHEMDDASQQRIWRWLDFALFSSPPSSSVQTVQILLLKLRATAHGGLAHRTESLDPVGDLWRAEMHAMGAQDLSGLSSGDRPTVSIASGSTITVQGLDGQASTLETTFVCAGMLICDQAESPTVNVLVPGFGFCRVSRECVTRCEPLNAEGFIGSPITTLQVHFNDNVRRDGQDEDHIPLMRAFYERLLRFAGPSLTALGLDCDLLNGTDTQAIAQFCPNLHSLCLGGFTAESLEAITRLYEAPTNCQITSLDLPHLRVPVEAFERFLTTLTPERGVHPIQHVLLRLRVGRGYSGMFRHATRAAIEDMLFSNMNITHFLMFQKARRDLFRGVMRVESDDEEESYDDDDPEWSLSDIHNGHLLPDYTKLHSAQKVALLSGLRQLREQNQAGAQLGSDLVQEIFSFAGDRVWRRAFTLRDIESELLAFMGA